MCWELGDRGGTFPSSPNCSPQRNQNKVFLLLLCSVLIGAYSLRLKTIQVIFHGKKNQTPPMFSKSPPDWALPACQPSSVHILPCFLRRHQSQESTSAPQPCQALFCPRVTSPRLPKPGTLLTPIFSPFSSQPLLILSFKLGLLAYSLLALMKFAITCLDVWLFDEILLCGSELIRAIISTMPTWPITEPG